MLRSHRLLLRDNGFACKWSDSSILSSQIYCFFKTHQKPKSSIYPVYLMDTVKSRRDVDPSLMPGINSSLCAGHLDAHTDTSFQAFSSKCVFTWQWGRSCFGGAAAEVVS